MNEEPHIPVGRDYCNVCDDPLDGSNAVDTQLGPVCQPCKTRLRWAHAWLNKLDTGMKGCTTKFNLRA